jgi:hypothetical protein
MNDYSSIVRLAVKLFGMALVAYGAITLSSYLPSVFAERNWREKESIVWVAYFLPLAVPILFGLLLWFFPATVANTVIRSKLPAKTGKNDFARDLEQIGVSLLGLFLLYQALSDIIYHVTFRALIGRVRVPDDFLALMAATTVEFVLALIFVFKARGVVNLMQRMRGR